MQARKSASQCAHLFIATTLFSCVLLFTASLAQAQVAASSERDAAEQRCALEREAQIREQQERTPDAGAQPGQSDLLITYQQAFPFRWFLSADDSGTKGTGKYQWAIPLSFDNMWTCWWATGSLAPSWA